VGDSRLTDAILRAIRSPAPPAAPDGTGGRSTRDAELDAIALTALGQMAYYQGDPMLSAQLGRQAVSNLPSDVPPDVYEEVLYSEALFTLQSDQFADADRLFGRLASQARGDGAYRLSARGRAFIAFHAGDWKDADAFFRESRANDPEVPTDRDTASAMHAILRLRRSAAFPRGPLRWAKLEAGPDPASRWAAALIHEACGDLAQAVAAARDVFVSVRDDAPIRLRIFGPDLVRIGIAGHDAALAADTAAILETVARRAGLLSVTAVSTLTSGMIGRNSEAVLESAALLAKTPRRAAFASAAEEAGRLLDQSGFARDGRQMLTEALKGYARLGAQRDVARLSAASDYAAIPTGARPRRRRSKSGWDGLSPTERRVAVMVSDGMTNREIAWSLSISPRTVDTHVQHLLTKLRVTRRAAIAAETIRNAPAPHQPPPR
jgi:DNA-binding CsgD family transcriptional regulator/tetratricopeptide (TPR) repeat protein